MVISDSGGRYKEGEAMKNILLGIFILYGGGVVIGLILGVPVLKSMLVVTTGWSGLLLFFFAIELISVGMDELKA